MEKDKLKTIFFIAVTDTPNSVNRRYSDFVYEMCYNEINNESELRNSIDFNSFERHDMKKVGNIKKSLYECLCNSELYIVLLDTYESGYNPNVWFELGVISTFDKPIILIAKEDTAIPFDINDINIIRIPKEIIDEITFDNSKKMDAREVDKILTKREIASKANEFSKNFISVLRSSLEKGNPFSCWYDEWEIESLGFRSLTDLFVRAGIIKFIQDPGVRAEFISSEREAFVELISAVNKANKSLRTTRFANQSIVSGERKNSDIHNEFMEALYNASQRDLEVCDRIVCNNEPSKWDDILQALVHSDSKMRVYVVQEQYRTGFELVVIDEKEAFIHFYQIDNHGDTDDNGDTYSHEIEIINSTLKIYGETVCKKLANIFDRLHHIDFDTERKNPSRTLLGVRKHPVLSDEESKRGIFQLDRFPAPKNDASIIREKTEEAIGLFTNALKNWFFESKDDKINLAIGIGLLDKHFKDSLSEYFSDPKDIKEVESGISIRKKKR